MNSEKKNELRNKTDLWLLGVGEIGEGRQMVQTSRYKFWGCSVQPGDYS